MKTAWTILIYVRGMLCSNLFNAYSHAQVHLTAAFFMKLINFQIKTMQMWEVNLIRRGII